MSNNQLQLGDKITLRDIDGIKKEFTVNGVNRKTYTIHYTHGDKTAPNRKGYVSFCRYMNKETGALK
jgi:hypothetical protein